MVVVTVATVVGGTVVAGTVISGVGVTPGVPVGFCMKTYTPAITARITSARTAISLNGIFRGGGDGGGCDTGAGAATGTAGEVAGIGCSRL